MVDYLQKKSVNKHPYYVVLYAVMWLLLNWQRNNNILNCQLQNLWHLRPLHLSVHQLKFSEKDKEKIQTHQVLKKFPEFVLLIRRNNVGVFDQQLVRIANFLKRDVDDWFGDECGLRVLKRCFSKLTAILEFNFKYFSTMKKEIFIFKFY